MEITHLPEDNLFKTVVDGYTAYVTYIIRDGKLYIRHTIVPPEIGGRGIAAQLVKATYDYALQHHLQPIATCSYGYNVIPNTRANPEKTIEDAALVHCKRQKGTE